ncbi:MAG TPA: lipopolysaccharide assembly protein LapA domain-containing protein [Pseudomonadales bacterium]
MKRLTRFLLVLVLLAVLLAGFIFTLNNTMAVPLWLGTDLNPQPLGLWMLLSFASGGLLGLLLGLGLWRRFRLKREVRQLRAKVHQLELELGVLKRQDMPAPEALPGK